MNTVTENEIKLGSKVKPNWKLSRVRARLLEKRPKKQSASTLVTAAGLNIIGFRKASLWLSKKKRTESGPGIPT